MLIVGNGKLGQLWAKRETSRGGLSWDNVPQSWWSEQILLAQNKAHSQNSKGALSPKGSRGIQPWRGPISPEATVMSWKEPRLKIPDHQCA